MKVALVEDDKIFLNMEKELLQELLTKYGVEGEIDTFSDGQSFLNSNTYYFAVFLDIDLPGLSGFDLAKKLKENTGTNIIFVSNKESLVYDSFDYQPMKFIRKDYARDGFGEVVPKLIKLYSDTKKTIVIKSGNRFEKIALNEILYFETDMYKLKVHTKSGELSFRDRMNQKEEELRDYHFVRIHSGYLVNLRYVRSMDEKFLVLENGKQLPVSRSKGPEVRKKVYNYLRQEL